MKLARLNDWEIRLAQFIAGARLRRFEWGANDCCLLVADATLAMTGTDPAADLRGYSTEAQAWDLVDKTCGTNPDGSTKGVYGILSHVARRFGLEPRTSGYLKRGDWALVIHPAQPTPMGGVVTGDKIAVYGRPAGIQLVEFGYAVSGWHLPFAGPLKKAG